MSFDLRELYQDLIIDHNNNPRNHYEMPDATSVAKGVNPICGDRITVYLKMNGNIVQSLSFLGCGCAISQASASLMTEAIIGKNKAEAEELFQQFHNLLTKNGPVDEHNLNKLIALA